MAIFRGTGGAGDASANVTINQVTEKALEAEASATAAASSATSAANSASSASTSATNAASSASSASTSATNAASSATSAASSASSASTSATNAATAETNAETAQTAAEAAQAAAETAETNASTSASEAATSASNAATSATNAATSATNASNSASSASTSATNAANSASDAADSATSAASSASTATTKASEASASASAAATSASNAATSETNAATSETNAATSETNAANSASSASTSATNASNSASAASTSATNAANSASAASTSATNAASSASAASSSATSASNSATASANSASAAATSATNAENAYDSFDDRYLGAKASDPSVDNDGDALIEGALYFNTTEDEMRVYTGSAWVAVVDLAGDVTVNSITTADESSYKTTTQNLPDIRPSLNLDFANSKTLDPRIDFTRASTATYYDGQTVAKAEENLLTYSQEFDNAAWTKTGNTVTADNSVAPDGTTTADDLIDTNGATVTGLAQSNVGIQSGQTYVYSLYAKAVNKTWLDLRFFAGGAGISNYFDLTNGVTGTINATSATITDVGDDWYRISVLLTSTGTSFNAVIAPRLANGGGTYTGDGTASFVLWGAQLEQRDTATAYTPTTSQPITNYTPVLQTASSGEARFDHDPVTGESKGLLIEEQRTNLLLRSEEFDNAYWTKAGVTATANNTTAPDGTTTAELLLETTSTGGHAFGRSGSLASATYTVSFFAKYYSRQFVRVDVLGAGATIAYFDIQNGVLGSADSGITHTITPVGNGWYRCTASFTGAALCFIGLAQSDGVAVYTGVITEGAYFWGAQLEAGAFPTSYIKTQTSQVTRSADSASITGSNFSEWYRADEGTLYAEATAQSSSNRGIVSIDDIITNRIEVRYTATNINASRIVIIANNNIQADVTTDSGLSSNRKAIVAYKVNDFAATVNATTVKSDTDVIIPIVSRLLIGDATYGAVLNGTIKKIAYYPKRLPNDTLQAMTEE